jgi:hypothetical protein
MGEIAASVAAVNILLYKKDLFLCLWVILLSKLLGEGSPFLPRQKYGNF